MEEDVRNPREVELEVRLRRMHTEALGVVQENGELLQVRTANLTHSCGGSPC